MVLRMFTKTADSSGFVEIIKGQHIEVKRDEAGPMHLDGEPAKTEAKVDIIIKPATLKVIVGDTFKN